MTPGSRIRQTAAPVKERRRPNVSVQSGYAALCRTCRHMVTTRRARRPTGKERPGFPRWRCGNVRPILGLNPGIPRSSEFPWEELSRFRRPHGTQPSGPRSRSSRLLTGSSTPCGARPTPWRAAGSCFRSCVRPAQVAAWTDHNPSNCRRTTVAWPARDRHGRAGRSTVHCSSAAIAVSRAPGLMQTGCWTRRSIGRSAVLSE